MSCDDFHNSLSDTKERWQYLTRVLMRYCQSLRNLGKQGHIKDVAIAAAQQKKGFGIKLIQALDLISKELGCYKVGSGNSNSIETS